MKRDMVNIAEFKRRMGTYMRRVRAGGTVVLIDRNQPVARLNRIDDGPVRVHAIPPKKPPETLIPPKRIRIRARTSVLDALDADRGDR